MIWLMNNIWNLIAGGAVLLLVVLCLRNVLPGKHHVGCSGNCKQCSGCPR